MGRNFSRICPLKNGFPWQGRRFARADEENDRSIHEPPFTGSLTTSRLINIKRTRYPAFCVCWSNVRSDQENSNQSVRTCLTRFPPPELFRQKIHGFLHFIANYAFYLPVVIKVLCTSRNVFMPGSDAQITTLVSEMIPFKVTNNP